jgi:16S rRNA (guanine(527)-N(7))-methyltransferase RsmG
VRGKSTPPVGLTDAKAIAGQVVSLVAGYLDSIRFTSDRILFLERIERLSTTMAFWGARMNLTAEPGDPQELAFHIIDSLIALTFADSEELLRHAFLVGNQVLDLGSGGGFPGLVLASASPANFTLIESRRKRSSFLAVAAAEMDLKNVTVEAARIKPHSFCSRRAGEYAQGELCGGFDAVTARGFAVPSVFHSAAAAALKPGGVAILYANPGQNLALPEAEINGLDGFRARPYTIPRGGRAVQRTLGLWRRR